MSACNINHWTPIQTHVQHTLFAQPPCSTDLRHGSHLMNNNKALNSSRTPFSSRSETLNQSVPNKQKAFTLLAHPETWVWTLTFLIYYGQVRNRWGLFLPGCAAGQSVFFFLFLQSPSLFLTFLSHINYLKHSFLHFIGAIWGINIVHIFKHFVFTWWIFTTFKFNQVSTNWFY